MQPSSGDAPLFPFENTYAQLPEHSSSRIAPTPVRDPRLLWLNPPLARLLGLNPDALRSEVGVAVLCGNRVPQSAEPLAMAYAGFQFGNWVPRLGDGRAILLGEIVGTDGVRRDIQLKGAGPTPYSRNGDGRATLGSVLRETIVSEAMAALGVPTTRALAAVATGEQVMRERPLPGAVFTRVARSHIRIGTFQFFAGRGDEAGLRALAKYAIERHDADAARGERPIVAFFRAVLERQAALVARWQGLGFIHGVMNTDNTSIAGETIDYGPCAFMDTYHSRTVYSSIDHGGRYAYCNQPAIAHWNLGSLARVLLPLFDDDRERALTLAQAELDRFPEHFAEAYDAVMREKLGLAHARPGDTELVAELLDCMEAHEADFTLGFRTLCDALEGEAGVFRAHFDDPAAIDTWLARWRARLAQEPEPLEARRARMRAANPVFIPRNHQVERAIEAATDEGDYAPFHTLVDILEKPFDDQPGREAWMLPPRPEQVVHQTFCGT